MTVVIVIAAIAIVAAVVFVAIGRGGELSVERGDYAPLELGPVSATDVVLLRPPTALWGYNVQATDEALERIAESLRARDIRIVSLEQLVTDLSRDPAGHAAPAGDPYIGARRRRDELEPGLEAGGGWQAGTQPAGEWQAGTQPAGEWQNGAQPAGGEWQNGTQPAGGEWQTGAQPAGEWQNGTQPTAEWPAGTEPTADWPPPEQSHD